MVNENIVFVKKVSTCSVVLFSAISAVIVLLDTVGPMLCYCMLIYLL